jgi:hypothetical protein
MMPCAEIGLLLTVDTDKEEFDCYQLDVLNEDITELLIRGDFVQSCSRIKLFSRACTAPDVRTFFLEVERINMTRPPNKVEQIKHLISLQKKTMADLVTSKSNADALYSKFFYVRSLNAWSKDHGDIEKALRYCQRALKYAREVYPESSEKMFRYMSHEKCLTLWFELTQLNPTLRFRFRIRELQLLVEALCREAPDEVKLGSYVASYVRLCRAMKRKAQSFSGTADSRLLMVDLLRYVQLPLLMKQGALPSLSIYEKVRF